MGCKNNKLNQTGVKNADIMVFLDGLAKNHYNTRLKSHNSYLSSLCGITDYVCGKRNDPNSPGYKEFNVSGHQQWFNRNDIKPFVKAFISDLNNNMPLLKDSFGNFEQLFDKVTEFTKKFVKATAVYDFCLRYAWNEKRNIIPEERVYFHTEPAKSAVLLIEMIPDFPKLQKNTLNKSYYIPFKNLPEIFAKNGLKAKDVEHLFCCDLEAFLDFYNNKTGKKRKPEDIRVLKKHITKV